MTKAETPTSTTHEQPHDAETGEVIEAAMDAIEAACKRRKAEVVGRPQIWSTDTGVEYSAVLRKVDP